MSATTGRPVRNSWEREAVARLGALVGDVPAEVFSGLSPENRIPVAGWGLTPRQRLQFGDLRYEGTDCRVVVEVESAGGVGNLVKYWPLLASGELGDKRFLLAHLFRLGTAGDYIVHRRLWEFLVGMMRGHLEANGRPWGDAWEARLFTYGLETEGQGISQLAQYIRAALEPPEAVLRTQRVTAADIRGGRIRVPHDTKSLFPPGREYVEVVLRGRALNVRWDPRMGPDQERSGVLLIGRRVLPDLVSENQVLGVTGTGAGPIRID